MSSSLSLSLLQNMLEFEGFALNRFFEDLHSAACCYMRRIRAFRFTSVQPSGDKFITMTVDLVEGLLGRCSNSEKHEGFRLYFGNLRVLPC